MISPSRLFILILRGLHRKIWGLLPRSRRPLRTAKHAMSPFSSLPRQYMRAPLSPPHRTKHPSFTSPRLSSLHHISLSNYCLPPASLMIDTWYWYWGMPFLFLLNKKRKISHAVMSMPASCRFSLHFCGCLYDAIFFSFWFRAAALIAASDIMSL